MTLLSHSVMHADGHSNDLEFGDLFLECHHFCNCLSFDLDLCLVVTCMHYRTRLQVWWSHTTLPLVLQALQAPFRQLPLATLSRDIVE